MMLKKGATSQGIVIRIIDASDGTPETGVVFNTSGIDLWYRRENGFSVDITEAVLTTPDLEDVWETGGFLHINDGYYRLDVPDAAFVSAAGVDNVFIGGAVTGMIVIGVLVQLTDFDPQDAVRAGLTSLPAAGTLVAAGPTKAEMETGQGLLATTADLLEKLGAVNEAAAAGDPSATESVMQYVKQIVNILAGAAGIVTMPAAAAPANAISIAEMIRAIYDDTNETQGDDVPGLISALNNLSAANVNTEADNALASFFTTAATLVNLFWDEAMVASTGAPAITGSMRLFMEWWASLSRNVINQTATTTTVRNDANDGDISTSTVSDDATTFVRGEFTT